MIIKPTPVESLYQNSAGVWDVLRTPKLVQELAIRHSIIDGLNAPIDPNAQSIDALLPIYESLTTLLRDNRRLLLYLPEALIPSVEHQSNTIVDRYIDTILAVFEYSLFNYEPRANYTDGDEPDQTPLISPAAIVARILVKRGLLAKDWYRNFPGTAGDIITKSYHDDLQTILPDINTVTNPKRAAWIEREKLRRRQRINYFEVPAVNLEGPLSQNLFTSENEISRICNIISTDRQLEFLYPVAIFYGSRFKGYGSSSSDLDFAVFVREQLRPAADRDIVERYINDKIPGAITFWLDKDFDTLSVHDFNYQQPPHIGMPYDAHILFNGVWAGDNIIIKRLCETLLKPMVQSNELVKSVYIRELERDLLQYRLLHRGYEAYYPTKLPTFLDNGYRWLATKLYLKYVFLP